jgi:hypothetical protein
MLLASHGEISQAGRLGRCWNRHTQTTARLTDLGAGEKNYFPSSDFLASAMRSSSDFPRASSSS